MFKAQHYFYIFLMYIHTYPEEDKMIYVLETQRIKVRRSSWFHFFCIQLIFLLLCMHIGFHGGGVYLPMGTLVFLEEGGYPL